MEPALWLLLWLRLGGWLRRLLRGARTIRGALLILVGLGFASCMCINPLIAFFLSPEEKTLESLQQIKILGPVGLLTYCLLTVLFSTSEKAITFTPSEVDFLFTGPFTRRQLLLYKIAGQFFGCAFSAVFLSVVMLSSGVWVIAAFPGLVLTLEFVSLFGMAVGLVANTIGARVYNRTRQAVLAVVLAGVVLAGWFFARDLVNLSDLDILKRIEGMPTPQVQIPPFSWFSETVTAKTWSKLLLNGTLALLVDVGLVGLVLLLDVQYLEASAAASEKFYAQIQRMRSGGGFAARTPASGRALFGLPSLPWCGGAGPIAWRQLTAAARGLRGLVFFMIIFGSVIGIPVLFTMNEPHPATQTFLGPSLLITALSMSLLMLPSMTMYDFRGDVDRMDTLKSLPIPAWALVLGQLTAPVVLLGLVQMLLVLAVQLIWGGVGLWAIPIVVLLWPIDFLTVALDNLLFLIFPGRLTPQVAGDFQSVGRQMLTLMAKGIGVGVACGVAAMVGVIVYALAGGFASWAAPDPNVEPVALVAATVSALLVLVGFCAALLPLIAWAFVHYDVARDTPA